MLFDFSGKVALVSGGTSGIGLAIAQALRDAGCAVLVVSEELDELFEVSDRLHVIARGKLSPSVPVGEATVEKIGEWMSGLWEGATPAARAEVAHG